jgi:hypothetical protein
MACAAEAALTTRAGPLANIGNRASVKANGPTRFIASVAS